MRAFDKRKNWRDMNRMLVRGGKMPNDAGHWISQTGTAGAHIAAGYGNNGRRRGNSRRKVSE